MKLKTPIRVLKLRDGEVFGCMKTPSQSDSPQDKDGEFLSAQGHPLYPSLLFRACSPAYSPTMVAFRVDTTSLSVLRFSLPSPQRSNCLSAL